MFKAPTTFGTALLQLRQERELRQSDVARRAKTDASYLAGLERGRKSPPRDDLLGRLLTVLKPTVEQREYIEALAVHGRVKQEIGSHSSSPHVQPLALLAERLASVSRDDARLIAALLKAFFDERCRDKEANP